MTISKNRVVVILTVVIALQLFAPFPEPMHEVVTDLLRSFFLVIATHEIIEIMDAFK
jgi:uncharacterized protein YhhL (DUF1145 family)